MSRTTPILLGLLLLAPAAALPASDEPDGTRIVVRDGEVIRLDDDGGPTVIRVDGASRRRYLGVRPMELTPDLRAHYGAPRDAGVLIGEVEADSPAAKAGLQVGDIVTAADGEKIEAPSDLSRAIRGKKSGDTVKLDVLRDRSVKHLTASVGERKDSEMAWNDVRPRTRSRSFTIPDFDFHWDRADRDRLRDRLTERLEDLEKRLKELERKLSR
jgi:membrane-associated protease RseP (regulator of RpoE activity)